jgi:hypothetical protein
MINKVVKLIDLPLVNFAEYPLLLLVVLLIIGPTAIIY